MVALSRPVIPGLLLLLVTLAVYWPAGRCSFINYDDHDYVTENYHVLNGLTWGGIQWAFTTGHTGNWHPLTWISHMVDCQVFGTRPAGPHLENALFHALNAVLLFVVLWELSGAIWKPAFVAALFALHPVHVESVAWISERKDVLSTFFGLLSLCAYVRYAADRKIEPRTRLRDALARQASNTERRTKAGKFYYGLALLFYALGLMSKPMLVTLPGVMLLLDYWPLKRISNFEFRISNANSQVSDLRSFATRHSSFVIEKVPFFALSAVSCVVTLFVQKAGGAVRSLERVPLDLRLENAAIACARYLGKLVYPANLANPYPYPGAWPAGEVMAAIVLIAGLTSAALWLARTRPWFFTGWFWFLGMLVPVIGLVQVGTQSMADRYMYIPAVGIFILIAWSAGELARRLPSSRVFLVTAGIVALAACAFGTDKQLAYWQNSGALFTHDLAVTKNNDVAYSSLGNYELEQHHWDEAIANYQHALQCARGEKTVHVEVGGSLATPATPDSADAGRTGTFYEIDPGRIAAGAEVLNNLGTALAGKGQTNEAIAYYTAALKLNPNHALTLHNLGLEFALRKQFDQAVNYYEQAVQARPDAPQIRDDLGSALTALGRNDEAVAQYTEALRLNPADARAENELGLALAADGRPQEALVHYAAALQKDPGLVEAHNNLGSALITLGKPDEAIREFETLLSRVPDHPRAHDNLGVALAQVGRLDEAAVELRTAVRLQPDNAQTRFNLGNVLALRADWAGAEQAFTEAIRLNPDLAAAHCNLGGVLAQQGRRQDAIAQFNEALRLNPNYEQAREQLRALGVGSNP